MIRTEEFAVSTTAVVSVTTGPEGADNVTVAIY